LKKDDEMAFRIEQMQLGDLEKMIELWKSCTGIGLSSADEPAAMKRFLDRNPGTCFTAWEGAELAGTVLAGHDGRRAYLYHVAVSPNHRRKGIGEALVFRAFEALQAEGIEKCHIFVMADNEEGKKFWHQTGWEQRDFLVIMSHNIP
jgi:N-acetylglutamate synthase